LVLASHLRKLIRNVLDVRTVVAKEDNHQSLRTGEIAQTYGASINVGQREIRR
jgi:hypothetical protein